MIDLKSLPIDQKRVVAVQIKLPSIPLFLVVATKGFLCGKWFSMNESEDKKTCICQMELSNSIDELLESSVVACNSYAHMKHIRIGMSGREALTYMLFTDDQMTLIK